MTATAAPNSSAVIWSEVSPSFWSAIRRGEFHGTVERTEHGYAARDATGALVGEPSTLRAAQSAIASRFAGAVPARPGRLAGALPAAAGITGAIAICAAVAAASMLSLGF